MAALQHKIANKLRTIRESKAIFLTTTGPRDTGQSDFKNRHTLGDLLKLAPLYEQAGYFSVEMHGGARFHQNLLSNMIDPFEESELWQRKLSQTLTQTLVRSTNVWGYRAYPQRTIRHSVRAFLPYIDVWRCFDFLNYVPNMTAIAEEVMAGGKLFEPAISFTMSQECTNDYYLKVARDMISLAGGTQSMILCIKDMAGVGSPERTASLVDKLLQAYPDLIIQLHRHNTDGLAIPALLAAAQAGAKILDVTDDSFVRFYGQPPVRPLLALLEEHGISVAINKDAVDLASDVVRNFINLYKPFESQYQGPSYDVLQHRMPGGAFPSSFEQAEKGNFLHLMPWILKGMRYGNRIIKYFDVTPGSQITWTTWASIIQKKEQEGGKPGVETLLDLLDRFVANQQDFGALTSSEQSELLRLYETAPDDLRKLLLGEYGPLPFGWPAEWVYRSAFGPDKWSTALQERQEHTPQPTDIDLSEETTKLAEAIGRIPSDQEVVLFLQHPAAAVKFIKFREMYGDTTVLPTQAWLYGLSETHPIADFELHGKPNQIRLISVSQPNRQGIIHVQVTVNSVLVEFEVETPQAKNRQSSVRYATPGNPQEIGSPMNGNLWRIGSAHRKLKPGMRVDQDEEIANIEVMKTENAVRAPLGGIIRAIHAKEGLALLEGQLLFEITPE